MIATPQQSLEAAASRAREAGVEAHILSDEIEGESREVGKVHAALARAVAHRGEPFARPCVILSGGETTVTIRARQPGPGGPRRARRRVLHGACAARCMGQPQVWALAADTDGIDGVEDNAGAFVAPDTLARAGRRAASCRITSTATTPTAISMPSATCSSPAHAHQRQRLPGIADPVSGGVPRRRAGIVNSG
jgi:glycerate-2-kinase